MPKVDVRIYDHFLVLSPDLLKFALCSDVRGIMYLQLFCPLADLTVLSI